ncbi:MAG TPA: CHAT domain-containing protein, partial [Streptosporangiaceae bacterium]|nr:CHAT domain-containing protein [Streptosporangiaceae bacterium]
MNGGQSDADRAYWRAWNGKPANAAERDEAIDCFRRLTVGPDPDGEWDLCRLMLAKLLSERAGFGLITGWAEPIATGRGWTDAQAALDLFTVAAASRTLTVERRDQARRAKAMLATGTAILRGANALVGGRKPDVAAVRAAAQEMPADDPYASMVPVATETIEELDARREQSPEEFTDAVDELTAPRGRRITETVLAVLTSINSVINPRAVPAEPLAELAATGLAEDGLSDSDAGVYHALSFLARYSTAAVEGRPVADRRALDDLGKARELLPAGHPLTQMLPAFTYQLLTDRFDRTGALIDRDAARTHQRAITELDQFQRWLAGAGPTTEALRSLSLAADANPPVLRGLVALDSAIGASARQAADVEVQVAIASTRRCLDELPAGNRWEPVIAAGLGELEAISAGQFFDNLLGERIARGRSAARPEAIAGLTRVVEAAARAGQDGPYHGHRLAERGARAQAALSLLTGEVEHLDAAIAGIRAGISPPGDRPAAQGDRAVDRTGQLLLLGQLLIARHRLGGERSDLDDGILALREARWGLIGRAGPTRTQVLRELATALWMRADRELDDRTQAIEAGLVALEERAADVLLQTGAARGLEAARTGSTDSVQLVDRCLAEGRLDAAVQALELGRALVLHSTTVSADVPERLDALGRGDLAESWRQELARTGPFPWDGVAGLFDHGLAIPPDVRHQVLDALRNAPASADWLVRPTVGELSSGLAAAGYDAYVYLLSPGPGRSGCALVLSAHGLEKLSLPDLHNEPVAAHRAALQAWAQTQSPRAWRAALESTCTWAWTAVVEPILRHTGLWKLDRPPRLVLIPTGNLSGIPWHAARTTGIDGSPRGAGLRGATPSNPRYAIQDAVFSYAASARQMIGASRRRAQPWSTRPVLLANPTGDLELATAEADELRRRCYPGAVCLGRFSRSSLPVHGRGTPRELLAWLPGGPRPTASVLHLGCHATVAGSLDQSYLVLAEHEKLAIDRIVDQGAGRSPGSPGFLAVLAACMTDLTGTDHDEALTLASALLASGACGVVGARWPVEDRATALLMLMFHHYLVGESLGPADALRAA